MHSRVARSLMGAALLLQLLQLAAGAVSAQNEEATVPRPFPPPFDPEQRDALAVFRLKDRTPCVCQNGGRCQRRVRRCECPLGYSGPHCELVDHELFAQVEAAEAAKKAQQQREDEEASSRQRDLLAPSDWLFYVCLISAVALMVAMLRVFVDLASSWFEGEDKKQSLMQQLPYDNKLGDIYTLPMHPPPYSEKAAAFVHSTPCCKQLQKPDFV